MNNLIKHTLEQCKEKLEIYRDHSDGEYHGGIEHTALITMINTTLAICKTPADRIKELESQCKQHIKSNSRLRDTIEKLQHNTNERSHESV